MNYDIHYLTEYTYATEVVDNLNALRVKPLNTPSQHCDDFNVRTDPETRMHRHTDYFGTEVVEFDIVAPHDHLTIDVRSRVSKHEPAEAPDASWTALLAKQYREAAGEFLLQAEPVPEHQTLDELFTITRARSPLATLLVLAELIPDRFEYRQGVTYVSSPVGHLLEQGAGVCQDFVHLALVLLRRHGIGARYVSGYLFAGGAKAAESVEVDTHAWLEALMPAADGTDDPIWVGVDPTNRGLASIAHIKIGHGRHYRDVPPVRGVYRGTAEAELDARVTMTRDVARDPAASVRT
jgi:transglutaminase-like putative cysteine protease